MTNSGSIHPFLARQLAKAGGEHLDVERLLDAISDTYFERDRERRRSEHANTMMADELDETLSQLERQNMRFRAVSTRSESIGIPFACSL